MGRNRFPIIETERIEISDGDWIEVKRDLNTGDLKKLEAAGMKSPVTDHVTGKLVTPIDWEIYEIERALIFLSDWSFRDSADKPVKLTRDALKSLDPATFEEVNTAIFEHSAKRAAEKKALRAAQEKNGALPS